MANTNDYKNEFSRQWQEMLAGMDKGIKYPLIGYGDEVDNNDAVIDLRCNKLNTKDIEEAINTITAEYGKPPIRWNHDPSKPIDYMVRKDVGQYDFKLSPEWRDFLTTSEQRMMLGMDMAHGKNDKSVIYSRMGDDIKIFERNEDMDFKQWQEYLMKMACSMYNISPSYFNKVNEQKSTDNNMGNVAILIKSTSEFRNIEQYLLDGGAYWNGKEHGQRYNQGRDLTFKGERGAPADAPTHFFMTVAAMHKQMNMYPGTSAAQQNIRRAGYRLLTVEDVKKAIKVTVESPDVFELFSKGLPSFMGGNRTVDISGLFGLSGRSGDIIYGKTSNSGGVKEVVLPEKYINMFEVADIVNTTTKTTQTKLLKLLGTQNIKRSGGIKVQPSVKMKSNK